MGSRPRVLLAWEGGSGRGHVTTLRRVAEDIGRNCDYDAALCDLTYADELRSHCALVFQGASLSYDRAHREGPDAIPTATLGEFYSDLGLRDPEKLVTNVSWWMETIRGRRISLVVADYAPHALMAARILGVASLVAGTGYGAPPHTLPHFPILLPEYSQLVYSEAETTAIINRALGPLGLPRLDRLAEVFTCSGSLVQGLSILDPYINHRDAVLLTPVAPDIPESGNDGEEIFAYLSTQELTDGALVEAMERCPHPIRAFMPGADAETKARLARAGVMVEEKPVAAAAIARRSRMMVNSAQHGTMCMGIAAGLPQFSVPQHLEQLYHARRAEERNVMRHARPHKYGADELMAMISAVYESADMRDAATRLRAQLLPELHMDRRSETHRRTQAAFSGMRRRAAPAAINAPE